MPQEPRNKQTLGQGRDAHFPRLLGERLCLDFVNTVESRAHTRPVDFLTDYAALARWGHHAGLYDLARRDELLRLAAAHPARAQGVYQEATGLRETAHRVFVALAHGHEPEQTDLHRLRQGYADALRHAELSAGPAGYRWTWPPAAQLEAVSWAVLRSTLELLTSPELARVKECPGCDDCGWLFLDTSKNRSRQWCSMEGCGSRAKMRRQYRRQRAHRPGA